MEIEFPIELIVAGTPVSQQAKLKVNIDEWKGRVRDACAPTLPAPHFATLAAVGVVLYYLPADEMKGDLDNIIKPVLDALKQFVFVDDQQVERLLVQKFEPDRTPGLAESVSSTLQLAWKTERPLLYVRVTDRMDEEPK